MSKEAARRQALAACGAAVLIFIGVCHEFVGAALFPWGPIFLGGPIGWNALGLFAITLGLLQLCGTLCLIKFPVVPFAVLTAVMGCAVAGIAAFAHHQFHLFAITAALAGADIAYFHRPVGTRGDRV